MIEMKYRIISKIIIFIILSTAFVQGCPDVNTKISTNQKDWWETASFYQIYPRSFMDHNNDGIGDLPGIKSRLQHLKDIGVNATWLSPIYKSPMADFGYDISDFYDIHPDYGTMKDFEELIAEAKKLGIKVILDFVPNHSSDENEWFKKSIQRIEPYTDYYVWHKGKPNPDGGRPLPPSNWLQAFRGSAWEWNEQRKEYYLHQFDIKQPDLNYRNPVVVEQMKHVLRYWLHKGVAGFRVDAVPWCFEVKPDVNGNYPDEPRSYNTDDPEEAAYLNHIHTQDQPETVDMVFQWRQLLDDFQRIYGGDTRVLMIETYSALDNVMKYYGTRDVKGAQMPFNFQFILRGNKDSSAKDIANIIKSWFNGMPGSYTPNWVMGNHDQRRVASRYSVEKIDTIAMILMTLPGAAITYNGDEIGMIDGDISYEDSKDPAAIRAGPEKYQYFTRDPARTPMQWDDTTSAGFSSNEKPWLPVNPNYKQVNVKAQSSTEKSHLNVYKALIKLRQTETLKYGSVQYAALDDDILLIGRYPTDVTNHSYLMVANIKGNQKTDIDLTLANLNVPQLMKYKVVSVSSKRTVGETANVKKFSLEPYEAVVLEST